MIIGAHTNLVLSEGKQTSTIIRTKVVGIESPSGVFPSLDWIDYSGNEEKKECARIGISILHRGIPSHEVRDDSIYLTLLRSIMVLSADGIMGPCIPTPDAEK